MSLPRWFFPVNRPRRGSSRTLVENSRRSARSKSSLPLTALQWLVLAVTVSAISMLILSNHYYARFLGWQGQQEDLIRTVYKGKAAEKSSVWLSEQSPQQTQPERNRTQSKMIWLMSFPNSGTTYTMENTLASTQHAVAVNYRPECRGGTPQHLKAVSTHGFLTDKDQTPYLLDPNYPLPEYILTKTHCDEYCERCVPTLTTIHENGFVDTPFSQGCRSTKRTDAADGFEGMYDEKLVHKAIHLFRSPFDNLVARMHMGTDRRPHKFSWARDRQLRDTPARMREWCEYVDEYTEKQIVRLLQLQAIPTDLYEDLPCMTEYYRWTQWHNHAVEYTQHLNVPVHIVYYEDYTSHYNATVKGILDFIEAPVVHDHAPFVAGKTYEKLLFELDVRQRAARFVQAIATPECWKLIKKGYFHEVLDTAKAEMTEQARTSPLVETLSSPGSNGEEPSREPVINERNIVWLMSFPNSGTSYTLANIQNMTNTTAGTNYGKEIRGVVPIIPNSTIGPYLLRPDLPVPRNILTKTHCTGYCTDCPAFAFVHTVESFQRGCGQTFVDSPLENDFYNASIVAKAVHLIRNPFENLVARKHLGLKTVLRDNPKIIDGMNASAALLALDTKEGLQHWCDFLDRRFLFLENRRKKNGLSTLDSDLMSYFEGVPCASELFRYLRWHDRAIAMTKSLNMTVLYIHYEDYRTNYEATVSFLLNFLELTPVARPIPFVSDKTYEDLYDPQTARTMARFIEELATPETMEHLHRYLDRWLNKADVIKP